MDPEGSLAKKLSAALASRDDRRIRRRLPDPLAECDSLIDFNSNDYLSLASSPALRSLFLQKLHRAPDILGSGGSRLLVDGQAHSAFEQRLRSFFGGCALLFNSGFDANVGFFASIPQPGDAVVYDEHIHASIHDGMRSSRVDPSLRIPFRHNSILHLKHLLLGLRETEDAFRYGSASIFVAVESLYSMDGTLAPLTEISQLLDEIYPAGNAYLIVDEAHSTGIYGPKGRGRVAELGLQHRVLARLHTFGKALAASGAVIVTNELVRDYLLNYARSLIYTTSLSYASIIAADASFDLLEDGTASSLSTHLLALSTHLVSTLRPHLASGTFPPHILSLPAHLLPPAQKQPPAPIIPILTSQSRSLSAYLLSQGMNARSITWPTVPKGKDRVRVCLHAGNTIEDVDRLVAAMVRWAREVSTGNGRVIGGVNRGTAEVFIARARNAPLSMVESKL